MMDSASNDRMGVLSGELTLKTVAMLATVPTHNHFSSSVAALKLRPSWRTAILFLPIPSLAALAPPLKTPAGDACGSRETDRFSVSSV